jgi:tripartite-type tricarboxylate transporter receptor subunit TctC
MKTLKTMRIIEVVFSALIMVVWFAFPTTAVHAAEKNFLRLIVPNAPGSGVDNTARALSTALGKALGKSVVIENFPGAGGIKGTLELLQAPADGATIGMVSNNHVINPFIYKKLPYDTLKDVTPISIVGTIPMVLVVYPDLPAKNVKELIALAKSKPGKLTYGSAGNGSVLHLAGALFCDMADVNITHVPYKGGSQLLADLLGKHVDMAFMALGSAIAQIEAGKLRALALTSKSSALTNVPTLVEVGFPGYEFDGWVAMIGPANLPKPAVAQLNAALKEALADKEVQKIFETQGTVSVGGTPEAAAKLMASDYDKCGRLVKETGAKIDY